MNKPHKEEATRERLEETTLGKEEMEDVLTLEGMVWVRRDTIFDIRESFSIETGLFPICQFLRYQQ